MPFADIDLGLIETGGASRAPAAPQDGTISSAWRANRVIARGERLDATQERIRRDFQPVIEALGLDESENPGGDAFQAYYPWLKTMGLDYENSTGDRILQHLSPAGPGLGVLAREVIRADGSTIENQPSRDGQIASVLARLADARKANPKLLPGMPDTLNSWREWSLKREVAARRQARTDLESTHGFMQGAAGLAGGMVEAMKSPEQIALLPVGGFGRTAATRILTEGLAQAGMQALIEPHVVARRRTYGEETSVGEMAADIGLAGLAGAGFQGLAEGAALALKGGAKMVQARRGVRPDTVEDRALADAMRIVLGDDSLTPDERAAIAVIEHDADVRDTSPYTATPEGDAAHRQRLALAKSIGVAAGRMTGKARTLAVRALGRQTAQAAPVGGGARAAFKARVRQAESGGNDTAVPRDPATGRTLSSAVGRYQFVSGTWLEMYAKVYGKTGESRADILAKRSDGAVQERLMDQLTADNAAALSRAGVEETAGNLYLAHFSGAPGAVRLHRADPGARAADVLGADAVRSNPFLARMAAGDVINWAHRKMGGAAPVAPDGAGGMAVAGEAAGDALPDIPLPELKLPEARRFVSSGRPGLADNPPFFRARVGANAIKVDPVTFQFKSGGDAEGVTDRLAGIEVWDELRSSPVMLWERGDGTLFVGDGHQRAGLARRIGQKTGQDIDMEAIILREKDGISARQVRTIAALKNIGEGTGTAIDAAKVIREVGVEKVLAILPRSSPLVRDAIGLARLSEDAFGAAVNNVVSPSHAALVGKYLPDDPDRHLAMIDLLAKSRPGSMSEADSIIRQGLLAGFLDGEQTDMFGTLDSTASLFMERASALEAVIARLKTMKKVFSTAADGADILEGAGSKIDVAASTTEASHNAQAIAFVRAQAFTPGAISNALNRAARRIAAGEPKAGVISDLVRDIRAVDIRNIAMDGADAGDVEDALGDLFADAAAPAAAHADPFAVVVDPVADSIEHDLRMRVADDADATLPGFDLDGSGARPVRDILAEMDADAAAQDAMRSCMIPTPPKGGAS